MYVISDPFDVQHSEDSLTRLSGGAGQWTDVDSVNVQAGGGLLEGGWEGQLLSVTERILAQYQQGGWSVQVPHIYA